MMKVLLLMIITGVCFTPAAGQKDNTGSPKNKLLILGSYHMNNPGLDVNNLEADDVLSDKRQQEIKEVVRLLGEFNPTKIGVERRYQTKSDTTVNQKYQDFLNNKLELSRNEIEQIGFRLARQASHNQIYALDAAGDFGFNEMVNYAQNNDQGQIIAGLMAEVQDFIAIEQKFLKENTVKDILLRMNESEYVNSGHGQYMKMLEIGKNKDYPGGQLVTDWYERNIKIFSNILRVSEQDGERLILIIGAGHVAILKALVSSHPNWEVVTVEDYLK